MRYAIDLSYLGTNYHGWQKQPNAKSVQECIETAFFTVLRSTIDLVASGRTDAGVHAYQQLAHFDFDSVISPAQFSKVNKFLNKDIALHQFSLVHDDFHARFDAISRSYIYHIHQTKNPFVDGKSYFFRQGLDLEKMNLEAKYLLGKQDFESFSKVKTEVNNFFCDINEAYFVQKTADTIEFHVSANRFLRGMVRALVGTLLEVGLGNEEPTWIKKVIEKKDRSAAGRNVGAEGLFLSKIKYKDSFNWQKIH
jgi:tRNA pseudouridine38-40 synthase